MTPPRLESVTITDFRSIKGTVTLPLGAPVVLIHGANGTGKTSIFSAIELALTGEVLSLRRSDPNYFLHLPHRDSTEARIALAMSGVGLADAPSPTSMRVTATGPLNVPLFDSTRARFFAERCYLAQSTLGRLLEIYQHADIEGAESPLTKFVKDVLGLDQLDAVIDGLHAADDIRRARRLAPRFRDTDESKTESARRLAERKSLLQQLDQRVRDSRKAFRETSASVPDLANTDTLAVPQEEVLTALQSDLEETALIQCATARRELESIRSTWTALATGPEANERVAVESSQRDARGKLNAWRDATGNHLEATISELRTIFPDLPSIASTEPDTALAVAVERIDRELSRCNTLLAQDDTASLQLTSVDQDLERAKSRLTVIDSQISELATDAAGLSQALAALVPHIHSEECPVCGRDYSEVSEEPLVVRLSHQVSRLTEQGDRLQALAKARAETIATVGQAERDKSSVLPRRLSQEARAGLKTRIAGLTESRRRLDELREDASSGATLLRNDAEATGRLSLLRERDQHASHLRLTLTRLCQVLEQEPVQDNESVDQVLGRLEAQVKNREVQASETKTHRKRALSEYQQLLQLQRQLDDTRQQVESEQVTFDRLNEAFEVAERRRLDAKRIGAAARTSRATIVRRVFNDSLNAVWRDLFVRLAPTEPFVPSFKLPENDEAPVVAALETIHREGGRGGTPGAMLSAGNLNTAALTLFLALHLSVSVRLPWLILDDPVQSMDEVHVSQFAALLRTLSKNHGRQVIIAVHDRSLFEYLALELSPAFPQDQLLTLELGRSDAGASLAEPVFRHWEPDKALAAT